ncbi:uncharacterized protein LOC144142816 isoform X2 [Haemaphysalis longicornis]
MASPLLAVTRHLQGGLGTPLGRPPLWRMWSSSMAKDGLGGGASLFPGQPLSLSWRAPLHCGPSRTQLWARRRQLILCHPATQHLQGGLGPADHSVLEGRLQRCCATHPVDHVDVFETKDGVVARVTAGRGEATWRGGSCVAHRGRCRGPQWVRARLGRRPDSGAT